MFIQPPRMFKYLLRLISLAFVFSLTSLNAWAQKVQEPKVVPEWTATSQPFRIVGNLYYVGTYDLACYLITTPEGNILINTGLAASEDIIKSNIESLGFKFSDIKILLTTQAHYDHVGAMADIKHHTCALLMVHEKEADVLQTGGSSDYELGQYGTSFKPVTPDRLLHDGDTIRLANIHLVLLHHPGHTKGSSSFLFTVKENQQSYRVLIANMPTIVTEKKFDHIKTYTAIASDYAYTLQAMKKIKADIWLASHAGQFNMHDKYKPGKGYNPGAFIDQAGYDAQLSALQKQFEEKIKNDRRP